MEIILINITYLMVVVIALVILSGIFKIIDEKIVTIVFMFSSITFLTTLILFLIIDCNILELLTK